MNERPPPRQGVPQTPSPYPPEAAEDMLEDLLASFPNPIDFETSFEDHKMTSATVTHVLSTAGSEPQDDHRPWAHSTPRAPPLLAQARVPGPTPPPPPPAAPCETKFAEAPPPFSLRSPSKAPAKRSTEASTPTRPFKRLREALSPKSARRSHARSPSKIPLPKSPADKAEKALPRQPSEIRDIVTSFRYAQHHLVRTVDVLESFQEEIEAERGWFADAQNALGEMSANQKRTSVALEDAERECARLRDDLARARADSGRAAQETQGMIAHLESTIAKEKASSAALREQVNVLTERNTNMEQSTDRRVFQLTQDLDKARQETARVKCEVAELRGQLDEAEFAHRALKEGGARLARELAEKDRKLEELERGRGRRWGMI